MTGNTLRYSVKNITSANAAVAALQYAGYFDASVQSFIGGHIIDTGTDDPNAESIVLLYVTDARPLHSQPPQ